MEMEVEGWRRYRNPEPPSDDFDFEITVIKNRLKTAFGDLTQFVITDDVFNYSSGWSNFSDSSDDSVISLEVIPARTKKTKEIVVKKEKLSPSAVSHSNQGTKHRNLSDEERSKRAAVSHSDQGTKHRNLSDEERYKRDRKRSRTSKRYSPTRRSDSGSEDSYEELLEDYKNNKNKMKVENHPIKQENKQYEAGEKGFGVYQCDVCNIQLNSSVTYQTHIRGKRHIKALNAESITNIAKMSLDSRSTEPAYIPSRRPDLAGPKRNFKPVENKFSYIQDLVDNYRKGPLPGLSYVVELRTIDKKETSYYCKLCESPCSTQSIMPHLTGYKHQLRCLEKIDKRSYDYYSYQPKKYVESKILRILDKHEKDHHRELIQVEEEVEKEPVSPQYDAHDQPGPSKRNEPPPPGSEPSTSSWYSGLNLSCKEDLDMSRNDYYCLTCHSHMNNINMWESHVRGKRHLKNKKKIPGESASKVKAIPCPDETAHLMTLIEDIEEPIVGLDFLSETQNEVGYMYNCHLCGACSTDNDIIDHLLTTKHRTKYLENLHNNGKPNSIVSINSLFGVTHKDSLIEEECHKVLRTYPPERGVQVFKTRSLFPSGPYY